MKEIPWTIHPEGGLFFFSFISILKIELPTKNRCPILHEKENKMFRSAKGKRWFILSFLAFCWLLTSADVIPFDKKLRVITDYAHVYLQPDESSPVVETLDRGHILSLLYSGKQKKIWYYVCFKSAKSGSTKSGYILDSAVEPLYDLLNATLIQGPETHNQVQYAPRKFEEMRWGMSKKQVLEKEGKPSHQERTKSYDIMTYHQKVINMDCAIDYIFAANKLSRTLFRFQNNYQDKNASLEDYQKVKRALIQRFGRPVEEQVTWHDPSYKEDFSAWGEAVSLGLLELKSRWLTPQTEILARLAGAESEIQLTVEYTGRQFRDLAKKTSQD